MSHHYRLIIRNGKLSSDQIQSYWDEYAGEAHIA